MVDSRDVELEKKLSFQDNQNLGSKTRFRGSNSDEYQIYLSCAEQLGWKLKTYDEWLGK